MINFFVKEVQFEIKDKRLLNRWLRQLANNNDRKICDLNYIFTSDPVILDINIQSLGHNYYTDIITFDFSEDYAVISNKALSGDIYISIDTVKANAIDYGEGFDRELHRVIAHGLLHILGYDDTNDNLLKEMRHQEELALDLWYKIVEEKN